MKTALIAFIIFSSLSIYGQDFIVGSWESVDENRISQSFVFNGDKSGMYLRGKSSFPIFSYSVSQKGDLFIIDYVMGTEQDKTPMFSIVDKISDTQIKLSMDEKERDQMVGRTPERPITLSKTN